MISLREEVELQMWWQLKEGVVNFWFDNWTLYFLKENSVQNEDLEVKQCTRNGEWVLPQLQLVIDDDMVEYIKDEINPGSGDEIVDRPSWIETTSGKFFVKLMFELIRRKKLVQEWRNFIWICDMSFKINFLMWRCLKGRIATDDNRKKLKMPLALRCHCCNNYEEETMQHLFLTSPIANKL